jgi:hypothetical protein
MRFVAIVALVSSLAFGQSRTLPPKDESGRDAQFAAFFAKFRETVKQRDTAALLRVVSPVIKNSFGGNDGAAEFREMWEIEKPGSEVWPVLDRLLGLGGAWFDPNLYCAPYLFQKFPNDLDAFEHAVVVGTGVRLRENASLAARVRAGLSFEIVRVIEMGEEWTEVRTLGGTNGFIASQYIYSPVGYRACFQKSGAEWRMTILIAGD